MAYGYNSQGQIVYIDENAPASTQEGRYSDHVAPTLTTEQMKGASFIPNAGNDYQSRYEKDVRDNGIIEQLNGPPPSGYKYNADGSLHKIGTWEHVDDWINSKQGMFTILGGMIAGPAVYGALAGGAGGGAAAGGLLANAAGPGSSIYGGLAAAGFPGAAAAGGIAGGAGAAAAAGSSGGFAGLGGAPSSFGTEAFGAGGAGGAGGGAGTGTALVGTGKGAGMTWMDLLKSAGKKVADHYIDQYGNDVTGQARASDPVLSGDPGMGGSSGTDWKTILGDVFTGEGKTGRVVGTAGDVASGIEEGRSKDRASQNDFNVLQDRTRLQAQQDFENALENRAALELKQQLSGQDYQGNAYRQAMIGALGKNVQDVTLGGVPSDVPVVQFKGGLRPSAVGPEGRAAASLLNEKAMKNLVDGMKTTALPDIERFKPSDYKTGNYIDTILGGIGTVGKIGDIWNERTQKGKDQSYIDKIRAEIEAQEKARQQAAHPAVPGAPPTTQAPAMPPGALMVDPITGRPILPDDGQVGGKPVTLPPVRF